MFYEKDFGDRLQRLHRKCLGAGFIESKKEFTVRAAARRGSILNSKSFETVRLGSLEESPDYVEAFKGCDVLIHCASRGSMRGHEGWLDESCAAQN